MLTGALSRSSFARRAETRDGGDGRAGPAGGPMSFEPVGASNSDDIKPQRDRTDLRQALAGGGADF